MHKLTMFVRQTVSFGAINNIKREQKQNVQWKMIKISPNSEIELEIFLLSMTSDRGCTGL